MNYSESECVGIMQSSATVSQSSLLNASSLDYSQLRLLALHAHPDDESSKGAATMAKYRSLGARVKVLTLTGGERGDILNPNFIADPALSMKQIREQEMAQAQKILDIEHEFLGYIDSGMIIGDQVLPEGCFAAFDPESIAAKVIAAVREFQPHVIISYAPNGGYPHPDHIQTHKLAALAYKYSGDNQKFQEGEPWEISKFYYFSDFYREHLEAIVAAMHNIGLVHPWEKFFSQWEKDLNNDIVNTIFDRSQQWPITTKIHAPEFFGLRRQALKAHASQISDDAPFLLCPLELEQETWPYEDYHLAHSRVDTSEYETDLFAGITREVLKQ